MWTVVVFPLQTYADLEGYLKSPLTQVYKEYSYLMKTLDAKYEAITLLSTVLKDIQSGEIRSHITHYTCMPVVSASYNFVFLLSQFQMAKATTLAS